MYTKSFLCSILLPKNLIENSTLKRLIITRKKEKPKLESQQPFNWGIKADYGSPLQWNTTG